MTRKRYKRQGIGSFFGEYLYDRTVRNSHFVRDLSPQGLDARRYESGI
jgi:hypothetical protein